jgi:hypothetical protein
VSFYVLDTAQDFLGVDNRVVHSSGFVEWYLTNIFLKLIDMFETKDLVWFSAMPLFLCRALLSGVGRTFIDEKPSPKQKNCHVLCFVEFRTLGGRLQGCLFLRICWMISYQHFPQIDRHV